MEGTGSTDPQASVEPVSEEPVEEGAPSWQKMTTVLVYLLAAAAFIYIGYAYLEQRSFRGLMDDLFSPDQARSEKAAAELASTNGSYPYLCNALVRRSLPEHRALCATVILRRLEATDQETGSDATEEDRKRRLRSGLNLEAITSALSDESPDVRSKALEIIERVGMVQNYQRTRHEEMQKFEALLTRLARRDERARESAAQELRQSGVRAIPYLAGVVFAENGKFFLQGRNVLEYADAEFRVRGLTVLRTIVQDVLKGSNQRRIVTLLGRRRCRLLLEQMGTFDAEEGRRVIVDMLNVSGRISPEFFSTFLRDYSESDPDERQTLLDERIEVLERSEKVRGELPEEIEKGLKRSGDTGERK